MSRWIATDKELLELYAALSGYDPLSDGAQVIFEFDNGIPIAAAAYDNFNGYAMHSHIWIAEGRKPSRVWWWAIHHYMFVQAGAKLAVAVLRSNNPKVIRLAESMGYRFVSSIPNYYGDSDALFYVGTEEDAVFWRRYRNGASAPKYKLSMRVPS